MHDKLSTYLAYGIGVNCLLEVTGLTLKKMQGKQESDVSWQGFEGETEPIFVTVHPLRQLLT